MKEYFIKEIKIPYLNDSYDDINNDYEFNDKIKNKIEEIISENYLKGSIPYEFDVEEEEEEEDEDSSTSNEEENNADNYYEDPNSIQYSINYLLKNNLKIYQQNKEEKAILDSIINYKINMTKINDSKLNFKKLYSSNYNEYIDSLFKSSDIDRLYIQLEESLNKSSIENVIIPQYNEIYKNKSLDHFREVFKRVQIQLKGMSNEMLSFIDELLDDLDEFVNYLIDYTIIYNLSYVRNPCKDIFYKKMEKNFKKIINREN